MEVDEGAEEKELPEERSFPVMRLAQTAFQLESMSPTADKAETKAAVMSAVEADKMTPYYQRLCAQFGWPVDGALLARLKCVALRGCSLATESARLKDVCGKAWWFPAWVGIGNGLDCLWSP